MKEPKSKLHEIKCYNIQSRGIKYISYSKQAGKLGAVRNDYSIEIWNMLHAPFLERIVPGNADSSVEAICWAGERLFSIGLAGTGVREFDLKTLTTKRKLLLIGESGLCLDHHAEKELIAVGTEEGIINIVSTSYDDLQFNKLLDRQDHRIICCKFDDTGEKLVSGGIDSVKVWNLSTGQVIHKMTTGRSESCFPTMVWCVDILEDFIVVSGDSRGKIVFWDGNTGAQTDYIHASTSDIMCIAVSENRKNIFCSGVEQMIRKFSQVASFKAESRRQQWVRSMKRSKLHTHDVMALTTIQDGSIVSGGIDGLLTITSEDLKHYNRFGPFLTQPIASLSQESRLVLLKYPNYLELWKLAKAESRQKDQNGTEIVNANQNSKINSASPTCEETYEIVQDPEKLIELHSKRNEMIICCAISNDGNWIAYSTNSICRLFCLKVQDKEKPKLKLMKAPEEFQPCTRLIFSNDSQNLLSLRSSSLSTFKLFSDEFEYKETVDMSDYHFDSIHLADLSTCSKYLAVASLCGRVSIWNFQRNKWNHIKSLPSYRCPTTSLKFSPEGKRVALAYSDHLLLEINLENLLMESSSILLETDQLNKFKKSPPFDLNYTSENDSIMLYRGDNEIKIAKSPRKATHKKNKMENSNGVQREITCIKKCGGFLLFLEFLGVDEIVSLEVNPVALIDNLPMPLRKKQFGAT